MPRLSAALFFLFVVAAARAEWKLVASRSELSSTPALEHRHVDLEESGTGERAIVDLAIFSAKSCRLRVVDNANGTSNLAEAMGRANCLAGVNGGYFDPNFAPLGLRVLDGKTTARLTRGRLLSGVLASNGAIQIVRVADFPRGKKLNAAVECGPFLVDLAQPVRGLEATRAARRSFAAVGSGDRAALGFCSDVTLADIGKILATPLGDFRIQRALNLDGGSSSGFWFKRENGSAFSISEQKNVRDFVGIVAK